MRQTRDPYRTWIAEVILQQTRMNQGLPYLLGFLETFPDVKALASASEDEVLRKWQGLGYYSRARNLHASARQVVEQLGGVMPGSYKDLLALKGVGPYTAAAIASWCYNEACAAVDGNVSRVIARLYGIEDAINSPSGEKQVHALATRLLDRSDPGAHNQAMIEFGALQCVPVSPRCGECPLSEQCEAKLQGWVDRIPVKIRNKKPVDRWFYYFMIRKDGKIILSQRGGKDIWEGLFELPMIECKGSRTDQEIVQEMLPGILKEMQPGVLKETQPGVLKETQPGIVQEVAPPYTRRAVNIGKLSATVRHQLSHQTIYARFLEVDLDHLPNSLPENWQWVALEQVDTYAMPRLIHRYLESSIF